MAGASSRHIEPLLPTGGTAGSANVDTPGQITWSGATDIVLVIPGTVGHFIFRKATGGSTFRSGDTFRFAGSVTITVDTPGAITFTGQSLGLNTSIAPTAGAITWTGQTIGLTNTVTPTAGAITWSGQTIGLTTSVSPTAGAITWTGQALGLKTSIGVAPGAILWQGAADIVLLSGTVISVTVPGAITWTGQAIGLKISVVPTAGAITFTGQSLPLKFVTLITTSGQITWTGSDVTASGVPPIFISEGDSGFTGLFGDSSTAAFDADSLVTSLGS
jgi:hypothetical protein